MTDEITTKASVTPTLETLINYLREYHPSWPADRIGALLGLVVAGHLRGEPDIDIEDELRALLNTECPGSIYSRTVLQYDLGRYLISGTTILNGGGESAVMLMGLLAAMSTDCEEGQEWLHYM